MGDFGTLAGSRLTSTRLNPIAYVVLSMHAFLRTMDLPGKVCCHIHVVSPKVSHLEN